jgi:threonine synthase
LLSYQAKKLLENNSKNIVLLTGSGLKDLKSVHTLLNIPKSIEPNVMNLRKIFSSVISEK